MLAEAHLALTIQKRLDLGHEQSLSCIRSDSEQPTVAAGTESARLTLTPSLQSRSRSVVLLIRVRGTVAHSSTVPRFHSSVEIETR
jgi:hypothetical protein